MACFTVWLGWLRLYKFNGFFKETPVLGTKIFASEALIQKMPFQNIWINVVSFSTIYAMSVHETTLLYIKNVTLFSIVGTVAKYSFRQVGNWIKCLIGKQKQYLIEGPDPIKNCQQFLLVQKSYRSVEKTKHEQELKRF